MRNRFKEDQFETCGKFLGIEESMLNQYYNCLFIIIIEGIKFY